MAEYQSNKNRATVHILRLHISIDNLRNYFMALKFNYTQIQLLVYNIQKKGLVYYANLVSKTAFQN